MKRINVRKGITKKSVVPEAKGKKLPKMKKSIAHPKSDADLSELKTMGVSRSTKSLSKTKKNALKRLYK